MGYFWVNSDNSGISTVYVNDYGNENKYQNWISVSSVIICRRLYI